MTDKLDVLDENLFRQAEEDMIQTWESFARPMEIQEQQGDCIDHLEDLSTKYSHELTRM